MTNLTLKACAVFRHDRYATETTGVVIDEASQHYARCSVHITPTLRNAKGAVMGGVLFTLADLAFATAANSECLEADSPLEWVSSSSSIEFLSQPKDNLLIAETECLKQGRTTCLYLIHITDGLQRKVAVVSARGAKILQ